MSIHPSLPGKKRPPLYSLRTTKLRSRNELTACLVQPCRIFREIFSSGTEVLKVSLFISTDLGMGRPISVRGYMTISHSRWSNIANC